MIDLMGNTTYTTEELKARAMARLSEQGLGLAERLANLERIAYSVLDPTGHPITDAAQVAGIGAALTAVEDSYKAEFVANGKLLTVIGYEKAQARVAVPALKATDKDADGNLLYPLVDNSNPGGTTVLSTNPAIIADQADRTAAHVVVTRASVATKALAIKRAKAAIAVAPK